ncbi:Cytochrome P450 [Mycena kentingensis (nom. inval.)]|nr:Cytochrome P450 [Mycena kentingensis (nom. inval.)]
MSAFLKPLQDVSLSAALAHIQANAATLLIGGFVLMLALRAAFRLRDVVEDLDGPEPQSWVYGNMLQVQLPPVYGDYEFKWQEQFGFLYRFKGCFGQNRIMLSDPVALAYVLNSPAFVHGPTLDNILHILYGPRSVVAQRGEVHKRFRSVLNDGFTASAVRGYEPILREIAQDLAEKWEEHATADGNAGSLDVCSDLSVATLGAISRAVLGRTTAELGPKFMQTNFETMALGSAQSPFAVLADGIGCRLPTPLLRGMIYLPGKVNKTLRAARALADNLGRELVEEKLEGARQGLDVSGDFYGRILGGKNAEQTLKVMSKEDIAGQTAVMLLAGQDTTANTVAFALYHLARDQPLQDALRKEISSCPRGKDMNYDSLSLLNAVVKEALRMYPAETMTDRMATEDAVLPLSQSITTRSGKVLHEVPVRKGQIITVNIGSYQRQPQRWGPDPHVFRPSRWLDGSVYTGDAVGPYANMLSFLGGNHICLGWRFAVLEMQVLIHTLITKFSFTLPPDGEEPIACWRTTVIPVCANGEKGARLCISRVL